MQLTLERLLPSIDQLLRSATLDDILFYAVHLMLYTCFIVGIYRQYLATHLDRTAIQVALYVKYQTQQAMTAINTVRHRLYQLAVLKYKKLRGTHNETQVIHVDPAHARIEFGGGVSVKVMRNDETSWGHFTLAWTVLSVVYTTIVSMYDPIELSGHSIGIAVVDIVIITWLCFYSSWFTNKIIGVINKRIQTPY